MELVNERTSSYSLGNGECVSVGNWRKARESFSSGNCVEIGSFRKSSRSMDTANCVEVGAGDMLVAVRDTKDNGRGPVLLIGGVIWGKFLRDVRNWSTQS